MGSPQDATVPAGGVATAELLDTYYLVPGSLTVTKTISGVSAGEQGAIIIGVNCDGLPLPEFTIPAGATGPQSHTYDNIPAGLTCTVTEQADGSTSTIGVVTTGSPQDVTIGANAEASAELTDTYGPVPGSLEVRKTINGPSAGSQGDITIDVTCDSATLPTWTIPAGTGATTLTNTYQDIPAGSSCTVTGLRITRSMPLPSWRSRSWRFAPGTGDRCGPSRCSRRVAHLWVQAGWYIWWLGGSTFGMRGMAPPRLCHWLPG